MTYGESAQGLSQETVDNFVESQRFAYIEPSPFMVHPAEWKIWEHYFETGEWDESLRLRYDQDLHEWVPMEASDDVRP